MMESASSCTNLSGSKPNLLTAHGAIACRKSAPGISSCFFNQSSSRPAMPLALGIPPTPGGRSSTRLLSVTANCPNKKNASRGAVATQFGLPRPAFRYEREFSCADFVANLATKSLISNGPNFSYCLRFMSIDFLLLSLAFPSLLFKSRQQHDDDHAPNSEQGVANGVGDGVAERGDLALGLVANQAERCRRRARPGNDSEVERVVEAEHVLGDEHPENQRDRGGDRAPQEEADALRFQTVDEAWTGGNADDGDEDVEADRVHEPDSGRRNATELRTHRAQPSADDAGDERPAGSRQGERRASYLENQRADQRADHDKQANERHVGDIGRTVGDTQHFRGRRCVRGAPDEGEQIAAIDLGARQNGYIGCGGATRDLAQKHAARRRSRCQLGKRLAVDLLVRYQDVDALHRHGEQLAVFDFDRRGPNQ